MSQIKKYILGTKCSLHMINKWYLHKQTDKLGVHDSHSEIIDYLHFICNLCSMHKY